MTSHLWILLLASIVATRAQELDLSDALFDDDSKPTAKPPVKPTPPKNSNPNGFDLSDAFDLEPKKPDVNPPKSKDDPKKPTEEGFDLSDALGPDLEPKKPLVPPREGGGTGGGSLDDNDLFDLTEDGSEYKPDGGRSGGRGADPQNDGASDHPQEAGGGALAAIMSSVGVAILGAASSYFAYQKKKLCFKVQGGEDPESGKNQRGAQSEPQVLSNLLRSS
ncbi:CD99 antigen-like protein 2 isoform X1 [Myxocyprinus asiaticus]|uniref:CD99 antigen-like protein 2 isoform X1 n=1 Tax=Myxocyprinus asiaticus TaxID=70543 RepID=UPI00222221B5|nr:CD99 antigen-like protein 2 isoform X1 [Myxocyprinus asiaticus]